MPDLVKVPIIDHLDDEPNKSQLEATDELRQHSHGLLELLRDLGQSRELSLARTNLEQAIMWATQHIMANPVLGTTGRQRGHSRGKA